MGADSSLSLEGRRPHLRSLSSTTTSLAPAAHSPFVMAPKTKSAATNGAPKKAQATAAPAAAPSPAPEPAQEFTFATYGAGKPDKAVYEAEQAKIKAEIDVEQAKLVRTLPGTSAVAWEVSCPETSPLLSRSSSPSLPFAERYQGEDQPQPEGRSW